MKISGQVYLLFAIAMVLMLPPSAAGAPPDAAAPPPEEGKMISVDFNGINLNLVIQQIQRDIDAKIIFDDNVVGGKKVTILAGGVKIPSSEALEFLRAVLAMHRLILVRQPGASEAYAVAPMENLLTAPGEVYSPEDPKVPDGSDLVTQVFKVENADTNLLANTLRGLVPVNAVFPVGTAGMMMVTGPASNVKRIGSIIRMVDVAEPGLRWNVYNLEHARADRVRDKVEAMMKALFAPSPIRPRTPPLAATPVMINERTNAVLVFATDEQHRQIAALIDSLDSESRFDRYRQVYKIKNTDAAIIAYMLGEVLDADVFTAPSQESQSISTPVVGTGAALGAVPVPATERPQEVGRTSKRHPDSKVGEIAGEDDIPLIILDPRQNSLLIQTTGEIHKQIEELIIELDARRPQVLIEVAIVEINDDRGTNIGLELMSINSRHTHDFGFGSSDFGFGKVLFDSETGLPVGKQLSQGSGVLAGMSSRDQIPVLLKALQTKTDMRVLSTPVLLVNDNVYATFTNLASEPYAVVNAIAQTSNNTVTSFGGYQTAGITVLIKPLISEGGYITLKIRQEVSSFVGESSVSVLPPATMSNNIETTITVPDDETIIIGGLSTHREDDSVSQIPLLGDIPLIGFLFGNRSRSTSKSQIYIFIRPLILDESDFGDLKRISQHRQEILQDVSGLKIGQSQPKSDKLELNGSDE